MGKRGAFFTAGSIVFAGIAVAMGCASREPAENLGRLEEDLNIAQQQKLLPPAPGGGDVAGTSVAVSGDIAIVGIPGDDESVTDQGSAVVFTRSNGAWTAQQKLTAPDARAAARFGTAVTTDGTTALVGAPGVGGVYVFERAGTLWNYRQKLGGAETADASVQLGGALALEGDTAAIGGAGTVRLFTRSQGVWSEAEWFGRPAVGVDNDYGGVALSGDTLLVGQLADDLDPSVRQGSVSVYVRFGTSWSFKQRLVPAERRNLDLFGRGLALSGNTAIVGMPGFGGPPDFAGAAYVYARSGTSFILQQKLTASDATLGDGFGHAVALFGAAAVVGAPRHEHQGRNGDQGAAYLFLRPDTQWAEQREFRASDGQNNDYFGSAVAVSAGSVVIGTPNDDGSHNAEGSASVFVLDGAAGNACSSNTQCASGFCVDGRCCDGACSGPCDACSVAAGAPRDGFCSPVIAGSVGSPACAPLACSGVSAQCGLCSGDASCPTGQYCDAVGVCQSQKPDGRACAPVAGVDCKVSGCRECANGSCVNGVCCSGNCSTSKVHCSANPCQHGGTCTDTPTGHACACPSGVNGQDCEVVFTQLAGGHYDMCGLRSDGKIACWGQHATDVPITAPTGTFKWVSLSQHLCAVRTDGRALCQGYGATTPPPLSFKSVYAGDMRACGILADDTAVCWGDNPLGAANVPPGTFRTLALGDYTCGIRTNGTIECWGLENAPPGSDVGQADPPPGVFTAVAASHFETCGISSGGGIVCWGTPSGLGGIPAAHPWTMLGNGFSYGCVLRSDGLLVCTDATFLPGTRPLFGGVTGNYKTFALSGSGFACGLRVDDAVVCWGAETLTGPPTGSL